MRSELVAQEHRVLSHANTEDDGGLRCFVAWRGLPVVLRVKWFWAVSVGCGLCASVGLGVLVAPTAFGLSADDGAKALPALPVVEPVGRDGSPPLAAQPNPPSPSPSVQVEPEWPSLPDLTQTDPDIGVAGGGLSHCGPVAVSNSLVWLSQRGYPRLLPDLPSSPSGSGGAAEGDSPRQDSPATAAAELAAELRLRHLELVRNISAEPYMGTSRWSGTGPVGVLRGLHRYVRRNGYRYSRLEYQGWRGHQKSFSTRVRQPQLPWIREALEQGGVAFAHVGWYKPVPRSKVMQRAGGHWLTVVAAGVDEQFRTDKAALVFHDPAEYAGSEPERVFVKARELTEGWLLERGTKTAFSAKGYYSLEGGMHIKRDGELAVLDGVVVMVMAPPKSKRPKPADQAE